MDFADLADHTVKESKKRGKYRDLASEPKKNLEIRGRVETIQNTALLRSTRKLRRVMETWEDILSLKLQ